MVVKVVLQVIIYTGLAGAIVAMATDRPLAAVGSFAMIFVACPVAYRALEAAGLDHRTNDEVVKLLENALRYKGLKFDRLAELQWLPADHRAKAFDCYCGSLRVYLGIGFDPAARVFICPTPALFRTAEYLRGCHDMFLREFVAGTVLDPTSDIRPA